MFLVIANIKFSKTQSFKRVKLGGFLGRLLEPLIKSGLPLIRNVLKPLAKNVLVPLGLTGAASAKMQICRRKFFICFKNMKCMISLIVSIE